MHYFIRIPDIAVAEGDDAVKRLRARGYKECPRAYFMTWWALRDAARLAELQREEKCNAPAPLVKEVGAPLPPGWVRPSRIW